MVLERDRPPWLLGAGLHDEGLDVAAAGGRLVDPALVVGDPELAVPVGDEVLSRLVMEHHGEDEVLRPTVVLPDEVVAVRGAEVLQRQCIRLGLWHRPVHQAAAAAASSNVSGQLDRPPRWGCHEVVDKTLDFGRRASKRVPVDLVDAAVSGRAQVIGDIAPEDDRQNVFPPAFVCPEQERAVLAAGKQVC